MDHEPFLGRQAVRAGLLTVYQLRTRYQAVYQNVYLSKDAELTAESRAKAAWLWAGGRAVLVGHSAAAVLGTRWLDGTRSAELVRADRHCPSGVVVHAWDLTPDDVCGVGGMRTTTPARTAFDIGRMLPQRQAVPILDALMRATGLKPVDVMSIADARAGYRGVRRLRAAVDLADGGAESPQESRVRLVLIAGGLPKPETQIEFCDRYGEVRIRVDMGWRQWKVAVEYDGIQHWTDSRQRSWDIDRIAMLEAAGWVVIRVSAEMLARPEVIIARVTAKLRAAGCPI